MTKVLIFVFLGILFLVQLGFMVLALVLLHKRGCKNLNLTAWTIIIILGQFVGSLGFLIVGLKGNDRKDYGDEYD